MNYYIYWIDLRTGEIDHINKKFDLESARKLLKEHKRLFPDVYEYVKYVIVSEAMSKKEIEKYLNQFYHIDQITIIKTEDSPSPPPTKSDAILSILTGIFFGLLALIAIVILI